MLTQLDYILGSASKVQLLRALVPLTTPVSGREAMRLGGLRSNAGARRALDELTDLHVLEETQAGGTHLYSINAEHHYFNALSQLFATEAASLEILRTEITRALDSDGDLQVLSVTVFGSAARKQATTRSDLDLLVLTSRKNGISEIRSALQSIAAPRVSKRLGHRISPYVMAREAAIARFSAGDPLMLNVIAEGRTLIGEDVADVVSA